MPEAARTTRQTGVQVRGTLRQFQLAAQFESHHHLAAQVHQAAHHRRGQRNRAQLAVSDHFLNLLRLHSKQQVIQVKRAELTGAGHKFSS